MNFQCQRATSLTSRRRIGSLLTYISCDWVLLPVWPVCEDCTAQYEPKYSTSTDLYIELIRSESHHWPSAVSTEWMSNARSLFHCWLTFLVIESSWLLVLAKTSVHLQCTPVQFISIIITIYSANEDRVNFKARSSCHRWVAFLVINSFLDGLILVKTSVHL